MSTTTAHGLLAVRVVRPVRGPRSGAVLDIAVAGAALAGSLVQLSHGGIGGLPPGPRIDAFQPGPGNLDLRGIVLVACSTLPLVAWRGFPLPVFAATAGATVVLAGLGYPLELTLGAAGALYLLAASREPHTPWTRRTTLVVAGLFVAYVTAAAVAQERFPASELLHSGLAWAVAWFAGERTRLRRQHITHLHERAQRAEHAAERERLLAVAEERARIARDLHDSAGHAINVIAVRAGAGRLRHDEDPERSRAALEAIEELARQTARDIDQIVGTLRRDDPPDEAVEVPLGLASLDSLVAQHRAAGLDVTLVTTGTGTTRPLGAAADQAAYRILQEALTNAARHGTGDAQVGLVFGDTGVELSVTNQVSPVGMLDGARRDDAGSVEGRPHPTPAVADPPQARAAPGWQPGVGPGGGGGVGRRPAGGHGLVGMRERATLVGGQLDAEPRNGTFRVWARIPHGAPHP